ncbi:MAG: type II secretion system F family protein, partial [Magnetococcus sp. DMHC-8]
GLSGRPPNKQGVTVPDFRYSARHQQEIVSGIVQAADSTAAASQLLAQRLEPLTIEPLPAPMPWLLSWPRFIRATTPDREALLLFSRQMAALLQAGIPLIRALHGVRDHLRQATLQAALDKVIEDLQSGRDLATAMAAHPAVFGRLLPRLVRMGEQTGRLDEAFHHLFLYLEMDRDIRRRLRTALRYPAMVLLTAIIALFVVTGFVIPAFAGLFARFGADLPLMTRILMAVSRFIQADWPVLLAGLAGLLYLVPVILRTRVGRDWWDRQILRLPLVGSIIHRALLARLARTFALGARAGLTVAQSLGMVGETLDNRCMARQLATMRERVERGDSMTQAAHHSGLFPPMMLQMLAIGEQTGNLEEMLGEVARFYDREVEYAIQSLSALVEPVLTALVAALVLVLALGIFLPMWNLGSVALGRKGVM